MGLFFPKRGVIMENARGYYGQLGGNMDNIWGNFKNMWGISNNKWGSF